MQDVKKSVKLERVVAIIIDMIIFGIITSIVTFILTFTSGAVVIDFDDILNNPNFSFADMIDNPAILFLQALINTVIGIFLLVFIPHKANGQTLGKMLMRIKATDELGRKPELKQLFKRAILLYPYYLTLPLSFLIFVNLTAYITWDTIVSSIMFFIYIIAFFMVIARVDMRGLHDLFAGTQVVHVNYDPDAELKEAATQAKSWADVDDETADNDDPWDKEDTKWEKEDDPWSK